MKSKKKLLLMGVGVMGALAMGVGATSTFAWYSASSVASLAEKSTFGSINTAVNGHVEGVEVEIGYTAITNTTSPNVAPDLTDAAGDTYYWVGSERDSTSAVAVGKFTFAANTTGVSAANKALLRNHKYKAYIKGEGNIRVLSSDSTAADSNIAKYTVSSENDTVGLAVYISFSDAADPAVTVSLAEGSGYASSIDIFYAVRTNNEDGPEAVDQTNTIENSTNYVKGDVLKGSDDKLYVCKGNYTSAASATDPSADTTNWVAAVMHADDGVSLTTASQVGA